MKKYRLIGNNQGIIKGELLWNGITIDSSHLSETDLKLMRELLLRDSPN
jgi:hypothetical protein